MNTYPILRYGKIYDLKQKLSFDTAMKVCKTLHNDGWEHLTGELRKTFDRLIAEDIISGYEFKPRYEEIEQCEGLISKSSFISRLRFRLGNPSHVEFYANCGSSVTICTLPNKNKIWVKFTSDSNRYDNQSLIPFYNKAESVSNYILSEVISEYKTILEKRFGVQKDKLKNVHNIIIKTTAFENESLKSLVEEIEGDEHFNIPKSLANNDRHVFDVLKWHISTLYQHPVTTLEEYHKIELPKGLQWLVMNTVGDKSAIYSKFHDVKHPATVLVGSLYGKANDNAADNISAALIRTIAVHL